jgi:uncharacterized SAM-binding protein YcdF (DUF218 family)
LTLGVFHHSLLLALGGFLTLTDPLEKADLIYVLAGDFLGARVLVGAELGVQGYASQVLLSGGPYSDSYSGDLAIRFAVEHGYPPSLFSSVRLRAQSTIEEAKELRPVFQRLGARRIILVTSNYHSRRAAFVFRSLLPGVRFLAVAAPDHVFNAGSWWKTDRERRLFFLEYYKIIGTLLMNLAPFGAE